MKKTFLFGLMVMMLVMPMSFVLVGCGDDTAGGGGGGGGTGALAEQLVDGIWLFDNGDDVRLELDYLVGGGLRVRSYENGWGAWQSVSSGAWSLSGNILRDYAVWAAAGHYIEINISISGNQMTWDIMGGQMILTRITS